MPKPLLVPILTLLLLLCAPVAVRSETSEGGFKVGVAARRIVPPEPYDWRGAATHALRVTLWYPADARAQVEPQRIGAPDAPPIFEAGEAAANAEMAQSPAAFPLVILSHGTGGTAQSMAWLGNALAAHGYVVAGVNHPGNNALEAYTVQGFILWWKRAQDVTAVIDALLVDPAFGPRIDRRRIGAAGFSLGGYTMVALAGGVTSMAQFEESCRRSPDEGSCRPPPEFADLRAKATALAQTDAAFAAALRDSERSYRDPRIRAVFAIAPALGPAFTRDSLEGIGVPVAIVAGKGDRIVPVAANAEFYAATIPHAGLTLFPDAGHYVFVDICTAAGRATLAAICIDPPDVNRPAIHRDTVALAVAFFDERLR
jgi:predicted dienelactone hydrolase